MKDVIAKTIYDSIMPFFGGQPLDFDKLGPRWRATFRKAAEAVQYVLKSAQTRDDKEIGDLLHLLGEANNRPGFRVAPFPTQPLPSERQGAREKETGDSITKILLAKGASTVANQIAALFPAQEPGTISEWFKKGQESVLRKNQSGCCCKIDDSDNVLSVCGAHQQWLEDTIAAQETPWVVERPCPNCVGAFAESEPGYPKSNRKWWPKCPECKGTGKLIRRLTAEEVMEKFEERGKALEMERKHGHVFLLEDGQTNQEIIDKALSIDGCPIRRQGK